MNAEETVAVRRLRASAKHRASAVSWRLPREPNLYVAQRPTWTDMGSIIWTAPPVSVLSTAIGARDAYLDFVIVRAQRVEGTGQTRKTIRILTY